MFGVKAYSQVAMETSSPWELINQLFAGGLRMIDEGKLDKAYRIVEEGLLANLVPDNPLSKGFADCYEVVLFHLGPGGNVATAREVLTTVHEAWLAIKPEKR